MLEGAADAGCAPPPEAPTEQNGRATPVCG
jgi:hypothetical protein